MEKVSMSHEDYLEAIVMLGGTTENSVRSVDIANKLGVSKASVNKAMNALSLAEMQSVIPEADEAMLKLFSPVSAVTLRKSYGGTGYDQVASQIAFWEEKLGK